MTQQKCLKHCSLFGRKDCHTFSIDSKNSSCTLYPKPCSKMNLTCTDCRTWTGKCRLPGSSTQNLISGTLLCYRQDLNNEPPNNRYPGKMAFSVFSCPEYGANVRGSYFKVFTSLPLLFSAKIRPHARRAEKNYIRV